MKFNLNSTFEQVSATAFLKTLFEKKVFIEIKELTGGTNQQNRYFHLLIGWFALNYGESVEFVKQIMIKRDICPEIFREELISQKTGNIIVSFKSWSDIDKPNRNIVIEKFRNWSAKEAKIYLPSANEDEFLKSIEVEIEKNKQWL